MDLDVMVLEPRAGDVEKNTLPIGQRLLNEMVLSMAIGQRLPSIANAIMRNSVARDVVEKLFGLESRRVLPSFSSKSWTGPRKEKAVKKLGTVAYYVGCFEKHFDQESVDAVTELMKWAGFDVIIPKQKCCGLPHIATGDKKAGRKLGLFNLEHLREALNQGCEAIITSCPSCGSTLKRHYGRLLRAEADVITGRVHNVFEFLLQAYKLGRCSLRFKTLPKRIAYHVPCHVHLQVDKASAAELMSLIPGADVKRLDRHCCGMAGSYGLKHATFRRSLPIGDKLFEEIRNTSFDVMTTDCAGCRMQIERGTGMKVLHPIRLLVDQFAGDNRLN
jgi:glycerol-3-phosphate dehydrogenase subunit C